MVFSHKLKRYVRKRAFNEKTIALSVGSEDVIAADWANAPATRISKPKPGQRLHVNWVIPPIGPGGGGHQNILRFVRFLEASGHTCTVYIYDPAGAQTQTEARSVVANHFPPMAAEVYVGTDAIGECDALFATAWQTAYPVFNANTAAEKLYFVQDYEPSFYPVGSESVLAENTYRFGFRGITAGKWLAQKLAAEYGMECDYYDFGSDSGRYTFENHSSRKKVLFYARPVTPRRGFELGCLALDLFARDNPRYEINMVGWDVSDYQLPFKFVNHGSLSLDELSGLYNQAAAALVISLTNMSLLPLELLSAGCIPVVNDGPNNRLVSDSPYIAYTPASPRALADALGAVVRRKDASSYAKRAAASVQNLSWEESGRKFEKLLVRGPRG